MFFLLSALPYRNGMGEVCVWFVEGTGVRCPPGDINMCTIHLFVCLMFRYDLDTTVCRSVRNDRSKFCLFLFHFRVFHIAISRHILISTNSSSNLSPLPSPSPLMPSPLSTSSSSTIICIELCAYTFKSIYLFNLSTNKYFLRCNDDIQEPERASNEFDWNHNA